MLEEINIITLNPEYFDAFLNQHLIKKALKLQKIKLRFYNLHDFTSGPQNRVDDYIFGGGAGMLLKCEPIYQALEAIEKPNLKLLLTAKGAQWTQTSIKKVLTSTNNLTIICGRFEGVDARVSRFCDIEIAVGNFVISNGEIFAMAIIDSLLRYIPGMISKDSLIDESFSEDIHREYPQYTRPRLFKSLGVPDVLINGNHKEIQAWKDRRAVKANTDFLSSTNLNKVK